MPDQTDPNHQPDTSALCVEGLTFRYGQRLALDNVSLKVQQKETLVLLGPNGAGKTTLFSLISGLFVPQHGSININGQDLRRGGSAALAPLGIVFQAQTLDLDLSVKQNLLYFCALHGIPKNIATQRIQTALKRLDMMDRLDDKVRSLNGGHRRRVEIARATLHEPRILLLDEPTVGLDIPTRRALLDYLHALPESTGTALLWATHLVDEILDDDRVVILHNGALVADGTPADLMAASATTSLEEAFNHFTGHSQSFATLQDVTK